MATKVAEIIKGFTFKKDPCATFPKKQIIEKFVTRLNAQRNPREYPSMYNAVFVEARLALAGVRGDAWMCWFYNHCAESHHFTETWHNLLSEVDKIV